MNGLRKRGRPAKFEAALFDSAVLGLRKKHPHLTAKDIVKITGCGPAFVAKVLRRNGVQTPYDQKRSEWTEKRKRKEAEAKNPIKPLTPKPRKSPVFDFSGQDVEFL